jgi:hypothetical protein
VAIKKDNPETKKNKTKTQHNNHYTETTNNVIKQGACLITLCSVRLYLELFVGGSMFYYVMFGSSLPRVVCRKEHVLLRYLWFPYSGYCVVFLFCFSSSLDCPF